MGSVIVRRFHVALLSLLLPLTAAPAPPAPAGKLPAAPAGETDAGRVKGAQRLTPAFLAPQRLIPWRKALCVGIDNYQCEGFAPLKSAGKDARDLGATLAGLEYEVTVMTDDAPDESLRPTLRNLRARLAELTHPRAEDAHPDDTLVITFSCHGAGIDGEPVLLPLDYGDGPGRTRQFLSVPNLLGAEYLRAPECVAHKKLLVVDACHSAGGDLARAMAGVGRGSCAVISACGEKGVSIEEDEKLGHGRLTQTLLDGLGGAAWDPNESLLDIEDLERYVKRRFRKLGWDADQKPEFLYHSDDTFDLAHRDRGGGEGGPNRDEKEVVDTFLPRARDRWLAGDYRGAESAARVVLNNDRKNAEAAAWKAAALQSLGNPREADADARAALDNDPDQPLALQVVGLNDMFLRGDAAQAARRLGRATQVIDADEPRWRALNAPRLASERLVLLALLRWLDGDAASAAALASRLIDVPSAPPEAVALAVAIRGYVRLLDGHPEAAVPDLDRLIDRAAGAPDGPLGWLASPLMCRATCLLQLERWQAADNDLRRLLAAPDLPRGITPWLRVFYGMSSLGGGHTDRAVEELTKVTRGPGAEDVPPLLTALAHYVRGCAFGGLRRRDDAVADFTVVAGLKSGPVDMRQVAGAMLSGPGTADLQPFARAMGDSKILAQFNGAMDELVPQALLARAQCLSEKGDPAGAARDYGRVIATPAVAPDSLCQALVLRGLQAASAGDAPAALADYGRAIGVKDAPPEWRSKALFLRGSRLEDAGEPAGALADYEAVIDLRDAPADILARARFRRGVVAGHQGRRAAALDDFSAVIDAEDSPVELVAPALVLRIAEYMAMRKARDPGGSPEIEQAEARDLSRLQEVRDARSEQTAWVGPRGTARLGAAGVVLKSREDCDRLIDAPETPEPARAWALVYRGLTWSEGEQAVADFGRAAAAKGAPADLVASALIDRGKAQGEAGNSEEALADYARAAAVPGAPHRLAGLAQLNRGIRLAGTEKFERAAEGFTRLVESDGVPDWQRAAAVLNRGKAMAALKRDEAALADYGRAAADDDSPPWVVAAALLARATFQAGHDHPDEAIADCTRVAAIDDAGNGPPARALLIRGLVYREKGMEPKAEEDFTALMARDDAPDELLALAALHRGRLRADARRWDDAAADFTRAVDGDGAGEETVVEALGARGECQQHRGKPRDAIGDYTRVIGAEAASPKQKATALLNRGACRLGLGDHAGAVLDFDAVLESGDAGPDLRATARVNRGWCREELGQPGPAMDDYSETIRLKGAPPEQVTRARVCRGVLLEKQGKDDEALAEYGRVIDDKDAPPDGAAEAARKRGWHFYQAGDFARAAADMERACRFDPDDGLTEGILGLALLRQGKAGEAKATFEAALKRKDADDALAAATDELAALQNGRRGPPETAAFLGWLRLESGQAQGLEDLRGYLRDHPDGPAAAWARQWIDRGPRPRPATAPAAGPDDAPAVTPPPATAPGR